MAGDRGDRSRSKSRSRSRERDRESRSSRTHRDRDERKSRDRDRSPGRDMLDICWKPVKEDPTNFDAWTHLLQAVEQMDEMKPAREAYGDFLKIYPYCYGYWRKFAEMERRHKHMERCVEVYEKGVSAIPLCCDLWLSYITFHKEYQASSETRTKSIRYLYERALTVAGLDFRSDRLWEDYVQWEMGHKRYAEALALFDRLIKVPTQMYSSHFDKLQELVNSQTPDRVLPEDQYNELYTQVKQAMDDKGIEVYVVEEVQVTEDGQEVDADAPVKQEISTEYRKKFHDEALKMFRVSILDERRRVHLATEHEVSKRWNYEEAIKRPYFHVKPLERSQLKNWRAYLDFEIGEGKHDRIVCLFERCLIACALYEDMWIRYTRYLDSRGDIDAIRDVFKRACGTHLPKKPTPHLAWSAFEEKNGHYEEAKDILSQFDRRCEGLVMVQMRRIGIERRRALKQAEADDKPDYASVCSRYERLIRDSRVPTRVASYYAIKFARFQSRCRGDKKLAEKIIKDALSRDRDNQSLHMQLVELALLAQPVDEAAVCEAFDVALKSPDLADADKLKFSQRKLEFLEDCGTHIPTIQEHFEFHLKLNKAVSAATAKRKSTSGDHRSDEKRSRRHANNNHMETSAPPQQYNNVVPQTVQYTTYQYPQQQVQVQQQYVPVGQPMQMAQPAQAFYYPPPYQQ